MGRNRGLVHDRFGVELGTATFDRRPGRETGNHGQDGAMPMPNKKKTPKRWELAIAALLSEPTAQQAAVKAGVPYRTLKSWLADAQFRQLFRSARLELVAGAIGRLQAAMGLAVDTLLAVAKDGKKDGDRVRAAVALLDHALRGGAELAEPDEGGATLGAVKGTADVVKLLAERLRQVDAAELPTAEKSRLTATLADALLRAIGVDVLDKRLEALQVVLTARKDKER